MHVFLYRKKKNVTKVNSDMYTIMNRTKKKNTK